MKEIERRKKVFLIKKPFAFLSTWRSLPAYELISQVLMFASVPMLAYGIRTYNWEIIRTIILTIITLYSGFFAVLIWNDITDADIDAIVHPDRPVPAGRISSKRFFSVALIFSAMTFIFAFLVSLWCFTFVTFAALFVTFHNKYLKKTIKIPAYSEMFSPFQWIIVPIFGFLAIFSNPVLSKEYTQVTIPLFGSLGITGLLVSNMILLVFFTYFADSAHDLPEGIHDLDGDRELGVKTYAISFGEKTTSKISFTMFFISGILGVLLFVKTILSPIFLIPFLIVWIYTLYYSYKLIRSDKENMKELGGIVGRKGFNYYLISYDLIFLDLLIQLIMNHFNLTI